MHNTYRSSKHDINSQTAVLPRCESWPLLRRSAPWTLCCVSWWPAAAQTSPPTTDTAWSAATRFQSHPCRGSSSTSALPNPGIAYNKKSKCPVNSHWKFEAVTFILLFKFSCDPEIGSRSSKPVWTYKAQCPMEVSSRHTIPNVREIARTTFSCCRGIYNMPTHVAQKNSNFVSSKGLDTEPTTIRLRTGEGCCPKLGF